MKLDNLNDAFIDELRDMLSAEKQLIRALPRMARAASSEKLTEAIETHLQETERQVQRLEEVFESLDLKPRAKKCEAMEGLIEEAKSLLEEDADPDVLDALIIAAAQKVEHYEIATYGTLCTWAEGLGHTEALRLLKENIAEEKNADEMLTEIAEAGVNDAARSPEEHQEVEA